MSETINKTTTFRNWLRSQLLQVMNVQLVRLPRPNSLVVHTWMGVVVNIYLLDKRVSTRAIKRILQDSTPLGIGSMFILDAGLLPDKDTRFEPKDWLLSLHALTQDRVFAYSAEEKSPKLHQIHFEPLATAGEYVVRYGSDMRVEKLRYYRRTVTPRQIKGDWQLADFGFNAFWRDPYKTHKTEYRRPGDGSTFNWRAYSQTTWDQDSTTNIPPPNVPVRSRIDHCYDMLNIERDASKDEVRAAFRKMALSVHPDTSGLPKEEAEARFHEISEAYEVIKAHNKWS